MAIRVLLYGLLCLAIPAQAQIYKCTDSQEGVTFTDAPCPSLGTASTEEIPNVVPRGLDKISNDLREAEQRRSLREVVDAVKERQVAADVYAKYRDRKSHKGLRIGMASDKVRAIACWGAPDDQNVTETAYGRREQWIYQTDEDNEFQRMYLYFQNDLLVVIQD